jgi:hypothetical protein
MAKRAPTDEKPYRPLLDPGVVNAAIAGAVHRVEHGVASKVIELTRAETPRVTTTASPSPPPAPLHGAGRALPSPQPLAEKFDQEKRILFTRPESQAIDRLVTGLATRLNTQVKVSHVVRALVTLLLNAGAEVDFRAGESGPLVRPPNGDARALQQFERSIARIFAAALRDAGPLKE